MQILNVIQCTNLGGMEQASLRLMTGLMKSGHSCSVLSLNPVGALGALLKENGIAVEGINYRGKGGWRSIGELRKRLRGYNADALIMTGHNLLAMSALNQINAKKRMLAMHFHHKGVKPDWQWRLIYMAACRRFDAITYPSDFIRNEAIALYPAVGEISSTVRNPLRIPRLPSEADRREARHLLGIPTDGPVVGNAGWLIPRKRFDVFLNTARLICRSVPDVRFVVAGDGVERDRLMRLATSLGIGERVQWLGWVSDMSLLYKSLDVLLFNSDWDAFPTTPLEAMSYGIPVAASVVNGGLREVICDQRCGFAIKEHDVPSLSAAVIKYLQDPQRTVGMQGRERVRRLCDFDGCVNQVQSLLAGDSG